MITVLVFRLDKIGDLIASTPLFSAIRSVEPELRIILIASPENAHVLEGHPHISEIRTYHSSWTWMEKWHFIRGLRRLSPIYSFSLSPQSRSHWLSYFTGAGIRGGILRTNRWFMKVIAPFLLHQRVWMPSQDPKNAIHQTQAVLNLLKKMGFFFSKTAQNQLSLPSFEEENPWVEGILKKIPAPRVLIHLGKGWIQKEWKREDLISFIQGISAHFPKVPLLLTVGDPEIDISPEEVKPALLYTGLSFSQWASLIAEATVVVTPDTSAVHIAAAQKIPVVVVYSSERKSTSYKEFGPYNTPHRALIQKNWSQTLEDVLKGVEELGAREEPKLKSK